MRKQKNHPESVSREEVMRAVGQAREYDKTGPYTFFEDIALLMEALLLDRDRLRADLSNARIQLDLVEESEEISRVNADHFATTAAKAKTGLMRLYDDLDGIIHPGFPERKRKTHD